MIKKFNKINGKKIISVIIILVVIMNIIYNEKIIEELRKIKRKLMEPIFSDGTINNEYFDIDSNGNMPKETTKGLNEAIEYAFQNNITDLKLQNGIYTVIGYNNSHYRGISLKSNINLDLNGSVIIQEANDNVTYANITMYNIENVKISNGIIAGEKEQHIYNKDNGDTHEWGYGIHIVGSNNITLSNLKIYNMTGDGIDICSINKGEKTPENIVIENCNIFECRRQGITIECGKSIIIRNNEIHNIQGTAPQAGINLEGNFKSELIDNVIIEENKIYMSESETALLLVGFINNVEIRENEIEQNILIYDAKDKIAFCDNKIKNSTIKFSNNYTNIKAGHNIKDLLFVNNYMENTKVMLSKIEYAIIQNNSVINGNIKVESSNCQINNNIIKSNIDWFEVGIELTNISGHTEKYNAWIYDNTIIGNYKNLITVDEKFYTAKYVK